MASSLYKGYIYMYIYLYYSWLLWLLLDTKRKPRWTNKGEWVLIPTVSRSQENYEQVPFSFCDLHSNRSSLSAQACKSHTGIPVTNIYSSKLCIIFTWNGSIYSSILDKCCCTVWNGGKTVAAVVALVVSVMRLFKWLKSIGTSHSVISLRKYIVIITWLFG